MATGVTLEELVQRLPDELKAEVHDFASFLLAKRLREEDHEWNRFALQQAVHGLEHEEDLYSLEDVKNRWT